MFGVCTAGGFFKSVMRKHPSAQCISWALEWNMNFRILGVMGDQEAADTFTAELPRLKYHNLRNSPNDQLRIRAERKLDESEDRLFHWDDDPTRQRDGEE